MKYFSTLTIGSLAFPGVTFTLKKMSEARRADFRLRMASVQAKLRDLLREAQALGESVNKNGQDGMDSKTANRIDDINADVAGLLATEMDPEYVRWGLKRIEGLTGEDEDGNDIALTTADQLIADGPPELFAEICAAIRAASTMSEEELKNFRLPSISGTLTDGNGQSISVPTAGSADTSGLATAPDTTQS